MENEKKDVSGACDHHDTCSVCQFCTFSERHKAMMCHNERSKNFGKILDHKSTCDDACTDYSPHTFSQMSFGDALRINLIPDDLSNCIVHFKEPDDEDDFSYVAMFFKTNDGLAAHQDARVRLMKEYSKNYLNDNAEEGK